MYYIHFYFVFIWLNGLIEVNQNKKSWIILLMNKQLGCSLCECSFNLARTRVSCKIYWFFCTIFMRLMVGQISKSLCFHGYNMGRNSMNFDFFCLCSQNSWFWWISFRAIKTSSKRIFPRYNNCNFNSKKELYKKF